jgi:hypothetical protein
MLEMMCVTNMSVNCVVVVGEWNVIMERRWKDTDKREQNCLRETHLTFWQLSFTFKF